MQEDSLNIPPSGYSKQNQVFTQESPKKSFHCNRCILLFKSKVYLFEHLNQVHRCDVDAALREAGLKYPENNKANTDRNSNSAEDDFECQLCDFKAYSRDILNEHERQCHKTSEDVLGDLTISENPETSTIVMSENQHSEAAGAKEISSVFSVISTSKSLCTLNSSKDLKTYKRPLKTIDQYFVVSSGSKGKPPGNSAESPNLLDGTKGTIILKESPSSSSPNSSGVFKVTAKSMIDIAGVSHRFLQNDQLTEPSALKPKEQSRETISDNAGKRTNGEIPKCPPAKRAKSYKVETKLPQEEHATEQQSSSNTEFPFDISEDEAEKKLCLVNGDSERSPVYYCKHCVYSDSSLACASTHYQNDHPYVRYNSAYIQDPSDRSATFRCLQCPVEFVGVAGLKKHFNENHPKAPNIFTSHSSDLSLVFKCFLCVFTTNELKALKKHFKESHPAHGVDNSLLYCKYLATEGQEGLTQSNICEKPQSPERPAGISPESACTPCKEVKNATSAQRPTATRADVVLYHCNNCKFSHKSVVVMHVHYQKCHQGQEITIDKIKQSTCVTSHTTPPITPDKSPNFVPITEESAPQTNVLDSSPNTESQADQSQPKRTSEDSKTKKAETTEYEGKCKELPNKRIRGKSKEKGSLSCLSPGELFFCQFCKYSSTNIKSVLSHHNAKHSLHALTCMEEILCYSAQVQKKKVQSEAKASAKTASSGSKTSIQVEVHREEVSCEGDDAADASLTEDNEYACAENMFYCQKCNYGNPSLKGIANHQNRIHRRFLYRRECIIEHTAMMRDQVKKSKSQAKEFSFSTHLPLPFINEGDEDAFFCHFCNYRQNTVDYVVRHYIKKHRGFVVTAEQVLLYTSLVREKTQTLLSETANQDVTHPSLGGKGNKKRKIKMLGKLLPASAPPSMTASQPQRTLHCYRCPYSTQYVYVLKRHIWKIHRANRSIPDVLRVCFKQGTLQTGYHCDVCVFSHEKAAVVYEHYQEHHPRRSPSLEYVSSRLYVGPDALLPTRKKTQIKYTGHCDSTNGGSPSGQSETKAYSCRACSFKCSSVSGITSHYRAVHPWSVKEDGSVLGVVTSKRPSANRQVENSNVVPEAFESYQVPLEFEAAESSTSLSCPYCPATFNTQHGLNTHCGMKHHEAEYENSERYEEKIQTRTQVFKCSHCAYVNTSHQGVLSHCHMKHNAFESRADILPVVEAQVSNWGDCLKRKGPGYLKLSGYMCETCPQICATQEKLNKHCEKDHTRTVAITVQSVPEPAPEPAPEQLPVGKRKLFQTLSNRGSFSQASFLSKKIYAVIKCQHCMYSCSTKIGLDRHVRVHHKTASASKDQDCTYKCVLCPSFYFSKIRLGSHYVKKHGRDSFLKYYAPVYKQDQEKQPTTSHDWPLTQQPENPGEACETSTTTEESKTLLVYRCPSCPYVNTSYHGTLTHCQMKHPDIVARADGLQTEEILRTNLVGCPIGKGANERGYICKICPLIYASLKKLKGHCGRDHPEALPAAPEHSAEIETEKPPELCSQGSAPEQVLKAKTPALSSTENDLCPQSPAETCQSNKLSLQNKLTLYKCHMCSYKGFYRRYLLSHYKKTHKLDPHTTHKLLQKYNKRKRAIKLPEAESQSGEVAAIKCKKCPELIFDSSQLLVAHYSAFHSSDCIVDFTVLSNGSKKGSTGLYRCVHCNKQMNGIRKLWYHLDCHREIAKNKAAEAAAEAAEAAEAAALPKDESVELLMQDEVLPLESVAQLNVASVQTCALPPSPLSPPSKPADKEQPQPEPREDKHACRRCQRTFMSLKGLRSHERSHAAMAAIKKLNKSPISVSKHNINKYVLYKAGTIKPFLCSFCSYRTTVMGLWRCHFRKEHQDIMMDPAVSDDQDEKSDQRADTEPFNSPEELDYWPEPDEEPEIAEKSLYLEPPDVQRQLNHYSSMAQSDTNVQGTKLLDNRLLHCEFCNFNTEHLSSQRRHYLNRHGKKILRCKDCEFFTAFRKTLEMHMKAGHSTRQSEPTREKDLRCPFCLYQTKNRNSMIDHIVLHREERVVPIEVRRPKLSRYLEGVVFRCHKCTFSSGSADNLRLHMTKHDDLQPYKCRLCYFDCTWLSDLEAHLSDKHQVVRNHELVGQVSLDQLQARVGRTPEEEPLSILEHHSNGSEDVGTEEFVTDCNEVPLETQAKDPAENSPREEVALQSKEAYLKQGQGGKKEEIPAKSSELDLQCEDAKPNAAVQEKREQELAGLVFLPAKPKLGDSEDRDVKVTQQKEEAADGSSLTYGGKAEDISICRTIKKADQDRAVKTEDIETKFVDHVKSELVLLDERGSIPLSLNPQNQVNMKATISARKNLMQANKSRPQGSFTVARHLLTLSSKCAKLKMSNEGSLGVTFTKCKKEQVHSQENSAEIREPYGEMPVLENEYLKEEIQPPGCCKKEDESDRLEQKRDKEDEAVTKDDENRCTKLKHEEGDGMKQAGTPQGAFTAAAGAEAAEEKPFTCEFCGRNLMNSADLERHIKRHGL